MSQITKGALWEYAQDIRDGGLTIAQAEQACKDEINLLYKIAKKEGRKASRFTLRGQLRQYWGFGDPCGLTCTVYGLNIQGGSL